MLASVERPQQCIMLKLADANAYMVSFTGNMTFSNIVASIQVDNKHEILQPFNHFRI